MISANLKLPISTLPELLAYARARPGQLHYAIDGSAIFQSVVARSFAKTADVDLVEVGYRTTSQALQDTVAGFTEMVFSSVAASSGLAEQGKLKRIAITSKARFPGVDADPQSGKRFPGTLSRDTFRCWRRRVCPARSRSASTGKSTKFCGSPKCWHGSRHSVTRPAARIPPKASTSISAPTESDGKFSPASSTFSQSNFN